MQPIASLRFGCAVPYHISRVDPSYVIARHRGTAQTAAAGPPHQGGEHLRLGPHRYQWQCPRPVECECRALRMPRTRASMRFTSSTPREITTLCVVPLCPCTKRVGSRSERFTGAILGGTATGKTALRSALAAGSIPMGRKRRGRFEGN